MVVFDLCFTLFFLVTLFGVGYKILNLVKIEFNVFEKLFFGLGLGIFLLSYFTLLVGHLGLIEKTLFWIVIVIVFILTIKNSSILLFGFFKRAIEYFKNLSPFNKFLILFCLLSMICNFLFNYAPPTGEDELSYHLNVPLQYIRAGRIINLPDNFCSYVPLTLNMVYLPVMLLWNDLSAKLINYFFGVFNFCLVFYITRKFVDEKYAVLAATVYYLMPQTTSFSGLAKVDLGCAFYALLSVYSMLKYFEDKRWFILFALNCGIVSASKTIGIFISLSLFIGFLFVYIFKAKKRIDETTLKLATFFWLTNIIIFSPWPIRSYIWTGNPFYPARIIKWLPYEEIVPLFIQPESRLSMLPIVFYNMFFGTLINGTGPLFLSFIPLIIFIQKIPFNIIFFVLLPFFYITILHLSGFGIDIPRYSHFCFGLLSIVVSFVVINIIGKFENLRRFIFFSLLVSLLFCLSLSLYFGLKRLPFFLGIWSREEYLNREYDFEGYEVVKWVNENIPQDSKILFIGSINPPEYHYKQRIVPANKPSLLRITSLSKVVQILKEKNIKYIIFRTGGKTGPAYKKDENGIFRIHNAPYLDLYWFKEDKINDYLNLIYTYEPTKTYIYEIK